MNSKIGFTDDGKVFMTILYTNEDKPAEITVQISADRALQVAEVIKQSALQAKAKAGETTHERNGEHVN